MSSNAPKRCPRCGHDIIDRVYEVTCIEVETICQGEVMESEFCDYKDGSRVNHYCSCPECNHRWCPVEED
jgi:hypothetical protein